MDTIQLISQLVDDPELIKKHPKLEEDVLLNVVRENAYALEYIKNQTPAICLAAVQENKERPRFFPGPSFQGNWAKRYETSSKRSCSVCSGDSLFKVSFAERVDLVPAFVSILLWIRGLFRFSARPSLLF